MEPTTTRVNDTSLLLEEHYLIDVLRAFLDERAIPDPPEGMSSKRFFTFARRQHVSQIVGYLALTRPNVFSPKLTTALIGDLQRSIRDEARQTGEACAVNEEFRRSGVNFMPLKGFVTRGYYAEPYLRLSGDYDVLVDADSFDRAREILLNRGYVRQKWSGHDESFDKPGTLLVELHFSLSDDQKDKETRRKAWRRLVPYQGTEYRFTNEDFYRFMVEHMLKHWIENEIKLRDFLDVAIYLRKFGAQLDRKTLDADLTNNGAFEFAQNVERLVDVWFSGAEGSPLLDEMALFIFRRHPLSADSDDREEKYAAQVAFESGKVDDAKKFKRVRYALDNFFPKRVVSEIEYKLSKTPSLLRPILGAALWCQYWFKRVFRVKFFVNVMAFLRVGNAKTNQTLEFQRRVGIDAKRLNSNDFV